MQKKWVWLLFIPVAAAALFFYFHNPEKSLFFPKCPFYVFTGCYCPGCGSQRAVHSFLHLRVGDSLSSNFLLFPATLFITYHYIRPLINNRFGLHLPNLMYKKSTPWIILVIVVLFGILRNIPFVPFIWLAPG